jgi:DMSO/TMAO reductase YedYZ heme-binding membrane subunit
MFLKQKKTIWILCSIPFWFTVVQLFTLNPATKKFWSSTIAISGYSAAALLAISLALSPLHKHLPTSQFFAILNKKGSIEWIYLIHPVIILGEIAFIILSLLALTSFNYWVKKLTWQRWKSLHRTVYIAEAAVFLHMGLQFGIVSIWGCLIFIPLFVCQRLRLNNNPNPV